ncbi:MAG: anaerobic sulfatase-maturation protein [Breznakibacter sp.]
MFINFGGYHPITSMNMPDKNFYFNPLPAPVYIMPKPVGAMCNIDCKYCYYLEKEVLYGKGKHNVMGIDLLEKFTMEYIGAQPTPHVLFTWHGGEALLRGIGFYQKALEFQRRYSSGHQIDNSLQTNGLLLNDEWCRFFRQNNFLIGISIDGPEHCHDKYRTDQRGNGTFARTMKGIELLKKHGVEFNVLAVVNDYNAQYPLEVYHFFKSIGARYIQFSPVVERQAQRGDGLSLLSAGDTQDVQVTPWSVQPLAFGKFMATIFDEWVRHDVGQTFVTMFDATLAGYMDVDPGQCIWARTCGHAGAMEFNGDVYACDHYVFPEYKLGNINRHSLASMMFSQKQLAFGADKYNKLPKQCKECQFVKQCHGECPKNRFARTKDGEPGLNYLCTGFKHYFHHVKPYMEFMANELRQQRPPANVMPWARKR